MNPQVLMLLKANLKKLRLSTMSGHIESHIRQAIASGEGYGEFLLSLTEAELQVRGENSLKRRLKEARFPLLKTLEHFDFEYANGLNALLIRELCECQYISEHRNIIFLGKSGTGKTHLATSLGIEACRHGIRTRFVSACGLVNELIEAKTEKTLQRKLKQYERYGLLIIDELGYVPFSQEGSRLLFQVLASRNEMKSVIITSNLGFGEWTQIFGDVSLTGALLDRLTHRAEIISCQWDSYRLKESLKRKKVR
jgi:DNA replication protein DnaC